MSRYIDHYVRRRRAIVKKWKILASAAVLALGMGFTEGMVSAAPVDMPALQAPLVTTRQVMGKVIDDHVIELPVITYVDYNQVFEKDQEILGQFGCSAAAKVLPDGDLIIGRSMDLAYSTRPAYIVRTAVPGYYKTVGISYNPYFGKDFDEVKESGLTDREMLFAFMFSEDVFNEKGFYIEMNMRNPEDPSTGIQISKGTRPGAKYRLSYVTLCRFLAERCATVDEALELVKTIDVHDMKLGDLNWGAGIMMADATGHYGLLELVDNQLIWLDGEKIQTNFYLNSEYGEKAKQGCGLGRYDLLKRHLGSVETEADMADLMYRVRFSQLTDPDTCEFDPCGDYAEMDETPFAAIGVHSAAEAMAEGNRDRVMEILRRQGLEQRRKSLEERRAEGHEWLSAFQSVVNCKKGTYRVSFFENKDRTYLLTVEE